MMKPSLVDEVTIFLKRFSALADHEHTDAFVSLFDESGATLMPVQGLDVLNSVDSIREWHQSVFRFIEILDLNVDLLHCTSVESMIFVQTRLRCQCCFSGTPDQLEALSLRVSMVIKRTDSGLKIMQMHCSLPGRQLREGIHTEFIDPFSDE